MHITQRQRQRVNHYNRSRILAEERAIFLRRRCRTRILSPRAATRCTHRKLTKCARNMSWDKLERVLFFESGAGNVATGIVKNSWVKTLRIRTARRLF